MMNAATVSILRKADALLANKTDDVSQDELERRLLDSYYAALRLAGAVIEDAISSRKRKPRGDAWTLLARYGGQLGPWADVFRRYSPVKERVRLGLSPSLTVTDIEHFEQLVLDFRAAVNNRYAWVPAAA